MNRREQTTAWLASADPTVAIPSTYATDTNAARMRVACSPTTMATVYTALGVAAGLAISPACATGRGTRWAKWAWCGAGSR